MPFHFKSLQESDFPLLLEWLSQPHVAAWYNIGSELSLATVQQKYLARVLGQEQVQCFIVYLDSSPVGFIQFYPAKEFDHVIHPLLSGRVAALDFYIGDLVYLHQGLGVKILEQFLSSYVYKNFDACLVDPLVNNFAAIRCFEKAGFIPLVELHGNLLMLKSKR